MEYDKKSTKLVNYLSYSVNQPANPKHQEWEAKEYRMWKINWNLATIITQKKYFWKILHINSLIVLSIILPIENAQGINKCWKAVLFFTLMVIDLPMSKHISTISMPKLYRNIARHEKMTRITSVTSFFNYSVTWQTNGMHKALSVFY